MELQQRSKIKQQNNKCIEKYSNSKSYVLLISNMMVMVWRRFCSEIKCSIFMNCGNTESFFYEEMNTKSKSAALNTKCFCVEY